MPRFKTKTLEQVMETAGSPYGARIYLSTCGNKVYQLLICRLAGPDDLYQLYQSIEFLDGQGGTRAAMGQASTLDDVTWFMDTVAKTTDRSLWTPYESTEEVEARLSDWDEVGGAGWMDQFAAAA